MDLASEKLRTFVAAAETCNFTLAARRVHLSQSAVSIQMRKLEEEVGTPLFTRGARGVELSRAGKLLLQYANRILKLQNEALALLTEPEIKGNIRLGASETYATQHLPVILKRFAALYPHVQIDLYCGLSTDLYEMLKSGKLDICLRNTWTIEEDSIFLREEQLVWIASKDGEAERQSPLPVAVFHKGCLYRERALQALREYGIPYRIAMSSTSIAGILAAVQSGLAVAPVGAGIPISAYRLLTGEPFPALPSAKICLSRSASPDRGMLQLIQHIVEEYHFLQPSFTP